MGYKKVKKACFIASSGGHWEELMCLKEIADAYNTIYVTEEGGQAEDSNLKKVYTLPQINRHEKNFLFHCAGEFLVELLLALLKFHQRQQINLH